MAIFQYKALKHNGTPIDGEVNMSSESEVQAYLREKELYIIEIKEKKQTDLFNINVNTKVKPKDLSVLCRKLHAMLISGLPIVTAIDILREQTGHRRVKATLHIIFEDLQKGLTFSEALKQHPTIFPQTMIFLIEAGEMSGTIDNILDRLAIDYEKDAKIRNKIKSAMVYPILLIFMIIALVTFMVVFILPRFMMMYDSAGMDLPKLTRVVIGTSESLTNYWYFYLAGIIFTALLIHAVRKIPKSRRVIDRIKLDLPMLRRYNRLLVTTRFTRTLSTMLFSGVPLLQSLENISRAIGNVVVSEKINDVVKEVRRGSDLATPIKKMDVFPRMVDSMINIGEESGTLDDILVRTTSYFDDELETHIKKMTQLFEPAMIVVMGAVVGTIVLAMVLPMFDLANTI